MLKAFTRDLLLIIIEMTELTSVERHYNAASGRLEMIILRAFPTTITFPDGLKKVVAHDIPFAHSGRMNQLLSSLPTSLTTLKLINVGLMSLQPFAYLTLDHLDVRYNHLIGEPVSHLPPCHTINVSHCGPGFSLPIPRTQTRRLFARGAQVPQSTLDAICARPFRALALRIPVGIDQDKQVARAMKTTWRNSLSVICVEAYGFLDHCAASVNQLQRLHTFHWFASPQPKPLPSIHNGTSTKPVAPGTVGWLSFESPVVVCKDLGQTLVVRDRWDLIFRVDKQSLRIDPGEGIRVLWKHEAPLPQWLTIGPIQETIAEFLVGPESTQSLLP